MREVNLIATVPDHSVGEVFDTLRNFERYAHFSDAVRDVRILKDDSGEVLSEWEVNFRAGVMRWTERDRIDPSVPEIVFDQVEGDAKQFEGYWRFRECDDGCKVFFNANFDMGIPSLAEVVEPVAERALLDNIESILHGFFGDTLSIEGK